MANLPQLDVRSVLDVVEDNFKKLSLKTYAIRMIYCGDHGTQKDEVIKVFRRSMSDVRAGYCDIPVSGLLLVYDSYFIHIIEGSEDSIHRHLRFMFNHEIRWKEEMRQKDQKELEEAYKEAEEAAFEAGIIFVWHEPPPKPEHVMFKRLKMLMVYHSISTLMFDGIRAITARPPSLVGNLDVYAPLAEHLEQLRICLGKLQKVCDYAKADEELTFDGIPATDPKMESLPETALLEYMLQSQHILDLKHVMSLHRRVDDYNMYFEQVWPLPNHFTPRYLYKLKVDDSFVEPLPIMPWELVKKEENEEEKEQKSGSDSSD